MLNRNKSVVTALIVCYCLLSSVAVWQYVSGIQNTNLSLQKRFEGMMRELDAKEERLNVVYREIEDLKEIIDDLGVPLCEVPKLNPFSEQMMGVIKSPSMPKCELFSETSPELVSLENGFLKPLVLNGTTVRFGSEKVECGTVRCCPVTFKTDYESQSGDEFEVPENGMYVNYELIECMCNITSPTKSDIKVLKSFHMQAVKKEQVYDKAKKVYESIFNEKEEKPLNVLFIGFDGTSHTNFYRKLPNTFQFLYNWFHWQNDNETSMRRFFWEELDRGNESLFASNPGNQIEKPVAKVDSFVYEFDGYNIVGDGTTAQTAALLTGKLVEDYSDKNISTWPFIFDKFSQNGYVTLFADDISKLGIFQMRLQGFTFPPSDHYLRPIHVAQQKYQYSFKEEPRPWVCQGGDEMMYKKQFNYTRDFWEVYRDIPKFGYIFSKLTHQDSNDLELADNFMLNYFKELIINGVFNNTALFFYSDHGARWGNFRSKHQGKFEETLPLLLSFFPKWWLERHPTFAKSLKNNQNRIFTALDIHATLKHIMVSPDKWTSTESKDEEEEEVFDDKPNYQYSLLSPIRATRTCKDSRIPDHYCSCYKWLPVSTNDSIVINGANAIVSTINDLLINHEECMQPLYVTNITTAYVSGTKTKVYQIRYETQPGDGIFEGTFKYINGQVIPDPYYSRMNTYGIQPCNPAANIRLFCECNEGNIKS